MAGSSLCSLLRCQSQCQLGRSRRAGGWSSKKAYPQGWQGSAGCWQEAWAPCHMDFSVGLLEFLHNMAAGFPRGSDAGNPDSSRSVFYDLALGGTCGHLRYVLLVTQGIPIRCGRCPQRCEYPEVGGMCRLASRWSTVTTLTSARGQVTCLVHTVGFLPFSAC